jgi:hypothetical protein
MTARSLKKSEFRKFIHFLEQNIKSTDIKWLKLKPYLQIHYIKKGDYIRYENGVCDKIVFINNGAIISKQKYFNNVWYIFYNTFRLRKTNLYQAFVHDFCSYTQQTKTNVNFQAVTDCEVIVVRHEDLESFFKDNLGEDFQFNKFLSEIEMRRTKGQIQDQLQYDFTPRYKRYKKKHPYLFDKVDSEDILCYLGLRFL